MCLTRIIVFAAWKEDDNPKQILVPLQKWRYNETQKTRPKKYLFIPQDKNKILQQPRDLSCCSILLLNFISTCKNHYYKTFKPWIS